MDRARERKVNKYEEEEDEITNSGKEVVCVNVWASKKTLIAFFSRQNREMRVILRNGDDDLSHKT